jgi:hypothetical protein
MVARWDSELEHHVTSIRYGSRTPRIHQGPDRTYQARFENRPYRRNEPDRRYLQSPSPLKIKKALGREES